MAFLLASPEVEPYVGWRKLREAFFSNYRLKLLLYLGYDQIQPVVGRIPVTDPDFFLEIFVEMKCYGLLGESSYEDIASHLGLIFRLPYTDGSLGTMMKNAVSDHSDLLKAFFNKINASKK